MAALMNYYIRNLKCENTNCLLRLNRLMFFVFFIFLYSTFSQAYYELVPDFAILCGDSAKTGNISITQKRPGDYFFQIGFDITKSSDIVQYYLHLEKCKSRADANCETHLKFEGKKTCSAILKYDEEVWNGVHKRITPNFTCPLKKGRYELRDGPMALRDHTTGLALKFEGVEDIFMLITLKYSTSPQNEEIFCIKYGGKIVSFKNT